MDRVWWDRYIVDVKNKFTGKLFTMVKKCHDVEVANIDIFKNSGAGAIALAARFGATKIILIGYDAKHTAGKKHWHGDHPQGLGNAGSVKHWPSQFDHVARQFPRLKILNCSRVTALTCFPLMDLETALHECD